ncbi:MAG: hypothetical protein LKI04_13435 [Paenibacillus lautus]|uniref:hypothetical protein n=1 Tax=Paenibacillus lautus TaxID=1401 RepID=UPI0026F17D07|nr:hypothetical protein [Paenibacillus lautus]MCI1775005.1 hypothetical protein [Paenibacillus lautus]
MTGRLIQVYPALRWSDTFRVLASVERSKPWQCGLAVWSKPGKAARPCGAVKDRECGSAVWCGQRPSMPLGRVEQLKSVNAALACSAAKDRECGFGVWRS